MTTQSIEKIQTGLTANYIHNWTVLQGLKEAMQNIAYGSIKAGKPAKLYFDKNMNMWAIKDKYSGFEKRHLYIGESSQRDDADGLGTFGEGWKIFLLIMARNHIPHRVKTIGFDFYGTLEPTPHGPEVLIINVEPNDNTEGTKVYADVEEEMWRKATQSFAILQGIHPEVTREDTILPERNHELWVQGVRIENNQTTNPLELYYSYNLTQRDLINRDRSHVNTELAFLAIRNLIFGMEPEMVAEFVSKSLDGTPGEDFQRGPIVPGYGGGEQKKVWLDVLADLHATTPDKLTIPSYNHAVNAEAKKKGLVLLDTPRKWDFELSYLGIRKADDVIDDRYNVVREGYSGATKEEKTILAKARTKIKKALALDSVDDLPVFQYVSEIKNPVNDAEKEVYYEAETNVLYLVTGILENREQEVFNLLLPELIVWRYKAKTIEDFDMAYVQIINNLLFKEV